MVLYRVLMKLVGANIAFFGFLISLLAFLIFHENYSSGVRLADPDLREDLSVPAGVAAYLSELQSMLLAMSFGNIAIFGFIISRRPPHRSSFDPFAVLVSIAIIALQVVSIYILFVSRMEVFQMLDANVISFQPALNRLGMPALLILISFLLNVALAFYLSWEEAQD